MGKALAVAVAAFVAAPAEANTFETLGFGPRAVAMGDAVTADANDYTATWYNPANLVTRKDVNFGLTFDFQRLASQIQLQNPSSPTGLDCSQCSPPNTIGYSLGLVFPLGGKVKDHVAIGLGLYLPSQNLLETIAPDPNQPFWYMYTGSPDRIITVVGVGIRIVDELSIGVGVQALADLVGSGTTVSLDLFSKSVTARQLDSHLETRAAPLAGIRFAPFPWLRFGASYRYYMQLIYNIPANVNLQGIGALDFTVSGVALYSPHTFNFGVAYDPIPNLTLTADANYQLWSQAPTPYMSLVEGLSGPVLNALGLGTAFNVQSQQSPPGFTDTINGHLGAEYRVFDNLALRAGVFYKPTPVPQQDAAETNILDGDTVGAGLGVGFAFADPLEVFQAPIKVDVAAQGQLILSRNANKAKTDTVPPYTYSAQTYALTAGVRYDF